MIEAGMVAIVTGASKGIGRAVAIELLARGVHVVGTSRSGANFDGLAAASTLGGRFHGVRSDVRLEADNRALIAETLAQFGRLDILVNNAGLGHFAPLGDLTYAQWDEVLATNLRGVFSLTKEALPTMIARRSGAIVMIGSLASRNTFAGGAAYCASKFGLLGLAECLMLDARPHNIRVATIMPGSVDTDFHPGDDHAWMLTAEDVGKSVIHVLKSEDSCLVSRVELRPFQVRSAG